MLLRRLLTVVKFEGHFDILETVQIYVTHNFHFYPKAGSNYET